MSRKRGRKPHIRQPHCDKYGAKAGEAQRDLEHLNERWKGAGGVWGTEVVLPKHITDADSDGNEAT